MSMPAMATSVRRVALALLALSAASAMAAFSVAPFSLNSTLRGAGASVAADGKIVVIGAPDVATSCTTNGSVAIYDCSMRPCTVLQTFTYSATGFIDPGFPCANLGSGVAIRGSRIVAGAEKVDLAFAYECNIVNGCETLVQSISYSERATEFFYGSFGISVALSDTMAIIGAPTTLSSIIDDPPTGYVFTEVCTQQDNCGGPNDVSSLTPKDRTLPVEDNFGASVGASADGFVVAGAPTENSDAGAVYLKGCWNGECDNTIETRLTPPASDIANPRFGTAVAIDNSHHVAASALNAGVVYIFTCSNASTTFSCNNPIQVYNPADSSNEFGRAVAILGSKLAVGAPNLNGGLGAVYTYDCDYAANSCTLSNTIAGGNANGRFGAAVSYMSESELIIGAPGDFTDPTFVGHVYLASGARCGGGGGEASAAWRRGCGAG